MWIWRRMMKVSWTEHKTNEEVLQVVDTEREVDRRDGSLLRITLEGRIQGEKVEDQEQCSWIGY